ncbi:uncharacterized protein [Musca autumnalis]|uniref:uncharacterized protein n=1 Tax=Musca autumnalis TaxID=221902 RepID=UPI003CEA6835
MIHHRLKCLYHFSLFFLSFSHLLYYFLQPKINKQKKHKNKKFSILGDQETNSVECNDSDIHEEDTNDESKSADFHVESCNTSSAEPASSTSLSSLSSVDSISSGPPHPPNGQAPLGYPAYPYPYAYPWYPPPACDSAGNPIWPFAHAMSPSPSGGESTTNNINPNWYYPYAMPPPPPPATPTPNADGQQQPPHPGYPPYPYYYPYYPMPPPPPFPASPSSSTEFDGQNIYAPYLPPPPPYHSYPYPVAPSYSQSSACSSRASSVLPDIIITPSTDDVPSKVIMQHHIKVEKEKPAKRRDSLDIEDVTSEKSLPQKPVEGSIVDILTQHLQNMSQTVENNLNSTQSAKKSYEKYFEQKSPEDNVSPVQIEMVEEEKEVDAEDSDESESSVDSDATTKQYDTRMGKEGSVPLQAIRSVTNIQVYNKLKSPQLDLHVESEDSEDEEDDATTADGESDVFDEDIEEIEFVYEHQEAEGEEGEEEIEQEAESECEEFIVEDNLSVIYEEESDYDKSSDYTKPSKKAASIDELEACIEENSENEEDQEEEVSPTTKPEEESNSVTVRLPLKFSFAKQENDKTPIATVVVEQPQTTLISSEKPTTAFSVATVESDSEAEEDSCDVSVTISLPRSSRSSSLDSEHRNASSKYPIEEMPLPEEALTKIESSQEDVSFSISLNKRNKFVDQTLKGDLTNNIAMIAKAPEKVKEAPKPQEEPKMPLKPEPQEKTSEPKISQEERQIDLMKCGSNFDFFATLMATKMQAQKIKEESANYWGKTSSPNGNEGEKAGEHANQATQSQNTEKEAKTTGVSESKNDLKAQKTPQTLSQPDASKEKSNLPNVSGLLDDLKVRTPKVEEPKVVPTIAQKEKSELPKVPEFKDDLKARTSFWSKYSTTNKTTTAKAEVTQIETPKVTINVQETQSNTESSSKSTTNSWENSSTTNDSQLTQDPEIDDIWADRDDDLIVRKDRKLSYWDKYSKSSSGYETETQVETKTEAKQGSHKILEKASANNSAVQESQNTQDEDIEDIWADRNDDLPAVKNLSKKLGSLQTAKDSFWSSVAEANKLENTTAQETKDFWSELKAPKKKPKAETITEIFYSPMVLRHRIDELAKALRATLHTPEPEPEPEESEEYIKEDKTKEEVKEAEQQAEEDEEVDFWAQIEESRQKSFEKSSSFEDAKPKSEYPKEEEEEPAVVEQEPFDPLKYPEEPREVDTDEEIDFWAEIEANRLPDGVEVTFERAATFWASRDRRNSADETPYKPVLPKPFAAKLPDEPPKEEVDIWATLEAHKGEEPVIVDPQVEEENRLAQEYENIPQEPETPEDLNNSVMDLASVHEPAKVSIWSNSNTPATKEKEVEVKQEQDEEPDFWAEIEKSRSSSLDKEKNDNLETRRKNFRKTKAFFTNPVEEPKEEVKDQTEKKPENSAEASDEPKSNEESSKKEEGEVEGEKKVRKPPKKEVKAKSKSKSPKGKSKELKAAKSPSSDLPEVYVEPTLKRLSNGLPDLEVTKFYEERKVSVRDRISVFETTSSTEAAPDSRRNSINNQKLSVDNSSLAMRRSSLSRNSSQRSESEMEEDDSGVTDMNKLSETETESAGSFPELRKMSSYQRAATHSRLFKLLQDDPDALEENGGENKNVDEFQFKPSRRKVVHNVSITRKQNPSALAEAESMTQRRERLSLPLRKNTSIDADNPSTPNSPASPIMDQPASQCVVSDKLVSELVQSLLLKSDSSHLRKLPMEKLQAAAKRVLEEELDSLDNTSVDSTPAMTPNDAKKEKSYADYYNTWSSANRPTEAPEPPRSLRTIQDNRRSPWTVRCPRVLSSKTINRDLARVTESPEIFMRSSKSPECFRQSRETSVSRWKKA